MRRWNGWGDDSTDYPLPESAGRYLVENLGEGPYLADATPEDTIQPIRRGRRSKISRLPLHPLITNDPIERLRHARGQSLPDWIALRSGRVGTFPDGVAYPNSDKDVRNLLEYALRNGIKVIPYGGGTSVVGHINPTESKTPILTLDMSRLYRLLDIDETSRLATFEAGIVGPEIETQLRKHGYTLGHYPQSFEYSTLGGWIATRSCGQQSYYYGRIEDLFAGGHIETLVGAMDLPLHPASAAGPDLRQMILGSEGRLGVITRATVRIRHVPEAESFHAFFFQNWETGVAAVQKIAQANLKVSMMRLSNDLETTTTLALSGKDDLVRWADRGLRLLDYKAGRCLLILGFTAERNDKAAADAFAAARSIIGSNHGLWVGTPIGVMWRKARFRTPYLRNTLWEKGYALDTLETAVPWSEILTTTEDILEALRAGLTKINERVLAFAHLSHAYVDGAGVYITFLYRRAEDPDESLHRWQVLKGAASKVIIAHGGTISHQHGVGLDHARYLKAEKGKVGMQILESVHRTLDPDDLLNPGKLIATESKKRKQKK